MRYLLPLLFLGLTLALPACRDEALPVAPLPEGYDFKEWPFFMKGQAEINEAHTRAGVPLGFKGPRNMRCVTYGVLNPQYFDGNRSLEIEERLVTALADSGYTPYYLQGQRLELYLDSGLATAYSLRLFVGPKNDPAKGLAGVAMGLYMPWVCVGYYPPA
ncbi:hypothetical protein [Calidithermus chliarophilus]|uniref:hypothetical protein n=1 Tax=Calidithermus chliarophilus TaxID=52023 RepID=UPI0003F5D02E|nr:hypothetical protein [Calidithermus chliarophilus]